ncbi:hypothetical protein [Tissierella praeacuta]|uniref:hypothetical protein n=1 Tax=Tissierella praeacuta TaxID=43131 RepID=UPI0028AC32A3|nr:hypothetical protein [Tissierella praeacuta]
MGNEFYIGLMSGVISTLIATLIIYIIKNSRESLKEKKEKYQYSWIPEIPVENSNKNIKNINKYPKDFNLKFGDGIFDINNVEKFVEGFDCFKMHLIKFMFTQKWKYKIYSDAYGVSYNLMDAKSQEVFEQISLTVSNEIIAFFKDYIIRIYSIKKLKNGAGIEIGVGLKGINEMVTINIPLKSIQQLNN